MTRTPETEPSRTTADALSFRPATHSDIEPTWAYRRSAEVAEWLPREAGTLEAYAAAFVQQPRLERTALPSCTMESSL